MPTPDLVRVGTSHALKRVAPWPTLQLMPYEASQIAPLFHLDNRKLMMMSLRGLFREGSIDCQQCVRMMTNLISAGGASLMLVNFLSKERSAIAIQYGMIAATISAATIAVVLTIGTSPNVMVMTVANALK